MPEALNKYELEAIRSVDSSALALLNDTDYVIPKLNSELTQATSNISIESKRKSHPTRYEFEPSKDSGERAKPVADLISKVTFTLGMPVIIAAGFDLMTHNKNYTFTKGTLNLYKSTAIGVTKAGCKASSNFYKKQLKPRSIKAFKAFWEPLEK